MSWPWFSQFTSTELGAFYKWDIAEYDLVNHMMKLLRSRTPATNVHSDYDSAEAHTSDEIVPVGSKQ